MSPQGVLNAAIMVEAGTALPCDGRCSTIVKANLANRHLLTSYKDHNESMFYATCVAVRPGSPW